MAMMFIYCIIQQEMDMVMKCLRLQQKHERKILKREKTLMQKKTK